MRGKRVKILQQYYSENKLALRTFFDPPGRKKKKVDIFRKLKKYWRQHKKLPEVANG